MQFSNSVKVTTEKLITVTMPEDQARKLTDALLSYQATVSTYAPANTAMSFINSGKFDTVLAFRIGLTTELEKLQEGNNA